MTKEENEKKLTTELSAKLVGQKLETYDFEYQVATALRALYPQYANDLYCHKDRYHTGTVIITIRNCHTIGEVVVSKKKGATHYNFFGHSCDWTFKAVKVSLWYNSIEDGFIKDTDMVAAQKKAEADKKLTTAVQFKQIMNNLNLTTDQVFALADMIRGYRYNSEFGKMVK